jgi:Trk K+ transport system NAD-binding subunit
VLVIGNDELTSVTARALRDAGARVENLRDPTDPAIRTALGHAVDTVVVISRDDHVSLRSALVVEGVLPGVPLVVTVFDRDVASKLESAVANVRVVSMADIVASSIAAPCIDEGLLSLHRGADGLSAVRAGPEGPEIAPLKLQSPSLGARLRAQIGSMLLPHELSAKILVGGLIGFHAVLLLDILMSTAVLHESLAEAIYSATKAIVTVDANPHVEAGPAWFKVFTAAMMLTGLAFTAIFTAGVINRLIDRRLVAICGRRAFVRKDHVVVVGLGQVGLRLCLLLRELRQPLLAIESSAEADYVLRAKDDGIPVVIGPGGSRFVLKRLALERARSLAAVTSDEVANIAIVVGAHGCCEDVRTVLRAGRGEMTNETRSLLKLGVVRDVYRIGGTLLAAVALGSQATEAFLYEHVVYLVTREGEIEPFAPAGVPA